MSKEQFIKDLSTILTDNLTIEEITPLIETPKDPKMGDLAFPAFQLARVFRKAPQQIAADIAEQLPAENYESVEAVGPYVNIKLKRDAIGQSIIEDVLENPETYGSNNDGEGGNVPIDMSSPNIAKPMSMGHLRSTVIGNALANISKKSGYNPIRINYLGDWGTQFGKLIVAYKLWGNEETVRENPVTELVKLYVHFHEVAEDQPELEDQAREVFKRLEDGDEEMLELWQWFRDESLKEFQKIYDLLDISFDSFNGEAFFNDKMQPIIDELEEKDLTVLSEGATIVDLEDQDLPPALIKKSDGATLYVTRDLAAATYRFENYDFSQSIYVVGNEQRVHFEQLKAVLNKMGHEWANNIVHVPFGLITKDGKKLSTRKGQIVLLEDVLNEAIDLALKQIEAKNPDLATKETVARQVGVGAVIFHDLKNERMNSFDFNLEDIVQFEGETGPYVQYTFARAKSILRRGEYVRGTDFNYDLTDDYSWELVKKIEQYGSVVRRAMRDYEPSVIAKYVIQLSQLFNKFYANVRILDEDDQLQSRLALVDAMTVVIKDALALLGLQAPEEM
ncbi:arginine--tRNA ligase [Aerococcaceae bacterium DSM 111176]|nr:arginine--tRNA ligase [Aerococcaceae bacterium DSM 111176]